MTWSIYWGQVCCGVHMTSVRGQLFEKSIFFSPHVGSRNQTQVASLFLLSHLIGSKNLVPDTNII